MDFIQTISAITILILLIRRRRIRRRNRRIRGRRCWRSSVFASRNSEGIRETLIPRLKRDQIYKLKDFLRVDERIFSEILEKIRSRITKKSNREPIPPDVRLLITLSFLAEGTSYRQLRWTYRVAHNTISAIIKETCKAIIDVLGPEYLSTPNTPAKWREVAKGFRKWDFDGCLGSVDGKHIAIKKPANSGSNYYNYKKFFSIILMGVVDSDCKFLYAGVGVNGKASDGGVWAKCEFNRKLMNNSLNLPTPVRGENPFVFIGDQAFPLRANLMKPHRQRNITPRKKIFNFRLSRARRTVENAFGILANRFRCLLTTMELEPGTAKLVVLACCVLHNLLISKSPSYRANVSRESDAGNPEVGQLGRFRGTNEANSRAEEAESTRNFLTDYFVGPGAVSFQNSVLSQTEKNQLERELEQEDRMEVD